MFAASARHTNAGITKRQQLRMLSRIFEVQQSELTRLEEDNARLRRIAARASTESLPSLSPANKIIEEVARIHDIPVREMKGPSRVGPVVAARQHAMYELRRRCPNLSLPGIGRMFGGRDHTTVLNAIRVWPAKAVAHGLRCQAFPAEEQK